jgi:hypothetical protein
LTGYEGNRTFIVPKVPTIARGNAEDNSWYRGDNKSAITRISSLQVLLYLTTVQFKILNCRSFSDGFLINFINAFYMPVSRRAILCDWVWRAVGRPHRFPHNNFSSVYQIFTKLGHMIPLWKGKNPKDIGVIRSKVKVTITINIFFDSRVVSAR